MDTKPIIISPAARRELVFCLNRIIFSSTQLHPRSEVASTRVRSKEEVTKVPFSISMILDPVSDYRKSEGKVMFLNPPIKPQKIFTPVSIFAESPSLPCHSQEQPSHALRQSRTTTP
ncbi:hypothetical protein L218DRAFT_260196 [Marasmius fiardii PR-910]|nr:hypothetical protein L218DRAFT_260196 [Marasmius fiardii PR-910]